MDFGAINVRTFMPNYQKNPTVKEEEGVGSDNESQSCKKTTFKSYYSVFYNIYILLSIIFYLLFFWVSTESFLKDI